MTRFDRIVGLYNQLGLNTEQGTFNRAEICGYCAGMDMIDNQMSVCIDEEHIARSIEFNFTNLINDLIGLADDMMLYGTSFKFINADINRIGYFAKNWCIPYLAIYLDGNGVSWNEHYGKSWRELENRHLRWSMIQTMGGNNV